MITTSSFSDQIKETELFIKKFEEEVEQFAYWQKGKIEGLESKIDELFRKLQDLEHNSSSVNNERVNISDITTQIPQIETDIALNVGKAKEKLLSIKDRINKLKFNLLHVGKYNFCRLPYDALQPGDLVCTYESTSTAPSVVETIHYQKMILSGDQKALHKMLHFEIIVKKHPRAGVYDVVHASGLKKEVVRQTENFKNYAPGQAIVVFRPKSEIVRQNIIAMAEKTAGKGNPWKIKFLDPETKLHDKILSAFEAWYYPRKSKEQSDKASVKKMVKLAVEAYNGKGFLDKKGKPMPMNCAEYAACVVNSAAIVPAFENILRDKHYSDKQKIKIITQQIMLIKDQKSVFPLPIEYGVPQVNPACFVDFILKHSKDWKPVGYIGSHKDKWKHTDIIEERLLGQLLRESNLKEIKEITGSNEDAILGVLQCLDIITTRHYFVRSNMDQMEKKHAAFAMLYAKAKELTPKEVADLILDQAHDQNIKNMEDFDVEFQEYLKMRSRENQPKNKIEKSRKGFIKLYARKKNLDEKFVCKYSCKATRARYAEVKSSLPQFVNALQKTANETKKIKYDDDTPIIGNSPDITTDKKMQALNIEKEMIKHTPNDENLSLKINKLSINSIKYKKLIAEKIKIRAKYFFISGVVAFPLFPLGQILLIIGLIMHLKSRRIELENKKLENRIKKLYSQARTCAVVRLKSDVGMNDKPWIHYTMDGTTWETEPLQLVNSPDEWEVKLPIFDGQCLEYKIFKGPVDENHTNPLSEQKGWMRTEDGKNVTVPSSFFKFDNDMRLAPLIDHPSWD